MHAAELSRGTKRPRQWAAVEWWVLPLADAARLARLLWRRQLLPTLPLHALPP
jgi:hypothetical protein